MENFIEYMWYLLTTPFKKVKKARNQWHIFCRVFGRRFDEVKEDILRARDEGMVATCSHDMLPVHGADRGLARHKGEHPENFRSRIAMYEELCRLGGTNEGVLLAVQTLGYASPALVRANDLAGYVHFTIDGNWLLDGSRKLESDAVENRWAEFYIIIAMDADDEHPISFDILRKNVRKWKEVGAKDNYLFSYHISCRSDLEDVCRIVLTVQGRIQIQTQTRVVLPMHADTEADAGLRIETKNNLFYLDGQYMLDGSKPLNTYEIMEEAI